MQIRLRPGAMQFPGTSHRTDDVIATLHDYRWNMPDGCDVFDQLIGAGEKATVDEVVALDARERLRVRVLAELRRVQRIQPNEARGRFPQCPGFGCLRKLGR